MIKIRWFSEYGIIGKYVLVLLLYSHFPPSLLCLAFVPLQGLGVAWDMDLSCRAFICYYSVAESTPTAHKPEGETRRRRRVRAIRDGKHAARADYNSLEDYCSL